MSGTNPKKLDLRHQKQVSKGIRREEVMGTQKRISRKENFEIRPKEAKDFDKEV